MKVPPMSLNFSTEKRNKDGSIVGVNGHKYRCLALENAWNKRFGNNYDMESTPILVVDLAPSYNYATRSYTKDAVKRCPFTVEITDTELLAVEKPDIIINYQPGATSLWDYSNQIYRNYVLDKLEQHHGLFGSDWFFFDKSRLKYCVNNRNSICCVVIPNGNKESFFERVDLQKVVEIVGEFGGSVIVSSGEKQDVLDNYIEVASIVITTPSVTAMEMAVAKRPLLLVKTSDDQTGDFSGIAGEYSEDVLKFLLGNLDARLALGRANNIENNIDKVVDRIYEEWKLWRNNNNENDNQD